MKMRIVIFWPAIFTLICLFDIIWYRGAKDLDYIEPPIGITAGINVMVSFLMAIGHSLIIGSYRSDKLLSVTMVTLELLSLASVFIWMYALNFMPLVLFSAAIVAIAVYQLVRKNAKLAGACLIWLMVLAIAVLYIPRMGYITVG